MHYDILVIGAGAAGLAAGHKLAKAGFTVAILEARNRIGGRINTLRGQGLQSIAEEGAEFMHGELPLTSSLLKANNISFYTIEGTSWKVRNNSADWGYFFEGDWEKMMEILGELKEDMPFADFLSKYFSEEKYQTLTDSVKRFVEGYDAADIGKISTLALREEWSGHDDEKQFRIEGGYGAMIEHLASEFTKSNGTIHLSQQVTEIKWKAGSVEAITVQGEEYTADKIVITLPVGVLKSDAVGFTPDIPEHLQAFRSIGYGGVIKFLLEFKTAFWLDTDPFACRKMPLLHFLFSDAQIPTWWTQLPKQNPLLTGWLGGPAADAFAGHSENALLDAAFDSLAYLFNCEKSQLQKHLHGGKVINWITDPFAQGAYAYKTPETTAAKKILTEPIASTIYFCGEALYDGPEMGTVEAALASGSTLADKLTDIT